RIPTRTNLDRRGIDLDSVRCPLCDKDLESEDHIFVSCEIASGIWKDVLHWWNFSGISITHLEDVISLSDHVLLETKFLNYFDVVVQTTIWHLWIFRNNTIFSQKRPQKSLLLNDIKLSSYTWITSRKKKNSLIKWDEIDRNAIANLHLALADGVLSSIEEKKSAKEILTEHVNNLNTLFSQLTSLSCKIEPQERAKILLQSLPDSYDQLIISLTSNVLSNYLVFDDVAAAILEEENRHNNREDRKTSSR
ncbi:gag-pol polyprotein, partial [Tanacetum coccineum]